MLENNQKCRIFCSLAKMYVNKHHEFFVISDLEQKKIIFGLNTEMRHLELFSNSVTYLTNGVACFRGLITIKFKIIKVLMIGIRLKLKSMLEA